MAHLTLPPLTRDVSRLPKWAVLAALAFVLLALMALSFVLGRETIGGAATAKPVIHTVPAPSGITYGGLQCHQHEQC
ncbi:MAG TPA: hypothetical protein VHX15_18920 [Frankiaceae bacterium]|jgi:hypothetical protein|nr:hypothetical protein [Frankiaceae bacterium]